MGRMISTLSRRWNSAVTARWIFDPALVACACGLLAVLVHLPILENDFTFDDVPAVQAHPVISSDTPVLTAIEAIWTTNYWGGIAGYEHVLTWRPLTTLSFYLDACLYGMSPAGFHGFNLVIHGIVTALLVWWLWLLTGLRVACVAAGALFAVLPVHVEAVAGIVNRAELLAGLFALLASICWIRFLDAGRRMDAIVTLLCFGLGLLSKEHMAAWPAVAVVLHIHRRITSPVTRITTARNLAVLYFGLLLLLAGYFYQRSNVLPATLSGHIPYSDNPLVSLDWGARALGIATTYFHYLRVTLLPVHLTVDYSAHAIPMPPDPWSIEVFLGFAGLIFSVGGLVWMLRKRQWNISACLAIFAVWYGLLSHIVILNTILLAERLMYLPSMALCGVFGLAVSALISNNTSNRVRIALGTALVLIICGYGLRSWSRTHDWRDQYRLFSEAVSAFPNSARARHNLGRAALNRGLLDEAELHFKAAIRIDVSDASSIAGLGELEFRQGRYAAAEQRLKESLQMRPSKRTMARLCSALVANNTLQQATVLCETAHRALPDDEVTHVYFVLALERSGQLNRAREEAKRLVGRDVHHPLGIAAIQRLLRDDT